MDTKLKNNNKRGNLLTVIVLLISSVGMLLFYPAFSSYITDQDQKEMRKEEQMLDMLDPILDGNYLLYNEISNETESSEVIEEYGNSRFGLMKKCRCWICWIRFWMGIICYIMKSRMRRSLPR